MGVDREREGRRVVPERPRGCKRLTPLASCKLANVCRSAWNPAHPAPTSSASGLNVRVRRLSGSSGVPRRVTIAGFGEREPNNWRKSRFGALRVATVRVPGGCRRLIRGFTPYYDICGVGTKRYPGFVTANACRGDSGGPMAGLLSDGPRLFGVSSQIFYRRKQGYRCGDPLGGSIYSRVSAAYDWLQAAIAA
jgi:hypothetical protein